jgi:hypothetical protein
LLEALHFRRKNRRRGGRGHLHLGHFRQVIFLDYLSKYLPEPVANFFLI